MEEFHRELLNGYSDGTVYVYEPSTKKLSILIDHLAFPNGIAYSEDSDPNSECLYVA